MTSWWWVGRNTVTSMPCYCLSLILRFKKLYNHVQSYSNYSNTCSSGLSFTVLPPTLSVSVVTTPDVMFNKLASGSCYSLVIIKHQICWGWDWIRAEKDEADVHLPKQWQTHYCQLCQYQHPTLYPVTSVLQLHSFNWTPKAETSVVYHTWIRHLTWS